MNFHLHLGNTVYCWIRGEVWLSGWCKPVKYGLRSDRCGESKDIRWDQGLHHSLAKEIEIRTGRERVKKEIDDSDIWGLLESCQHERRGLARQSMCCPLLGDSVRQLRCPPMSHPADEC